MSPGGKSRLGDINGKLTMRRTAFGNRRADAQQVVWMGIGNIPGKAKK
jgi:hypothetical protein